MTPVLKHLSISPPAEQEGRLDAPGLKRENYLLACRVLLLVLLLSIAELEAHFVGSSRMFMSACNGMFESHHIRSCVTLRRVEIQSALGLAGVRVGIDYVCRRVHAALLGVQLVLFCLLLVLVLSRHLIEYRLTCLVCRLLNNMDAARSSCLQDRVPRKTNRQ